MPIKRKVNKDFFKAWSPDMAYVLGFLMADGCITVNSRGSQYIDINICDEGLLYKIRKVLGSNHAVSRRVYKKAEQNDSYRLQIGSKDMCSDLRELGMCERKSHIMKLPDVPKEYFGHFVRGYFDGDGSVWSGMIHPSRQTQTVGILVVFTCGSELFLKDLRAELSLHGNISTGSFRFHERAHRLQYSINDSILLYELMYGNLENDLFLERKKEIFDQFLAKRE